MTQRNIGRHHLEGKKAFFLRRETREAWLWDSAMAEDAEGKETLRKACIDFLLHENYLLTAFELLHELQEDGLVEQATKLQLFFANADMFPPDELAKMHALEGSDVWNFVNSGWKFTCILSILDLWSIGVLIDE